MDAKQKALKMIWNQIAKEDENYYRVHKCQVDLF